MRAIDALIRSPAFPARRDGRFVAALRACAALQGRRFPQLARLYRREGFDPWTLRRERDVARLPFLHVSAFKEFPFAAGSRFPVALTLTSSGTSGQKSRTVLDRGSLARVKRIAESVYGALGMVDRGVAANYVCMTYDPRQAKDLGTAFTDELLTSFTSVAGVHYAIRRPRPGEPFGFDLDGTLAAIRRFAATGLPLRILGFPAHVRFTRKAWNERAWPSLRLGRGSWVLTGGGWKGHQGAAIPKREFRREVSDWLGIPAENLRDLYGLVEHGVPYVECRLGRMHVPAYARVLVRDPQTLRPLPYGRKGLLQLVTPYLTSFPSFSVLASDWGELRARCGCGTPGETLSLHGRAGRSPAKGCAVTASELLEARR
ncbi:MAG: acyl-protein synthetase [Elusimicrobia bacterium]|nr:acyl-protein synthetase [Elusimicrobiota bacterium]